MTPVKVNIYLSYSPADRKSADTLREWLYPMRDEVNLFPWPPEQPKKPDELALSWKLLIGIWQELLTLPWNRPEDEATKYAKAVDIQRQNAHIYIFLTSFKSLSNKQVEHEIMLAAKRRIECSWREECAPLVMPILLSPSLWKESSRLAQFVPLANGTPISKFPQMEDGYLTITEEISAHVKRLQRNLNEERFYQYYPNVQ